VIVSIATLYCADNPLRRPSTGKVGIADCGCVTLLAWRHHGTSAEALSVCEHLPEPHEGGLAILTGHIVHCPAMAKAIPQLGELRKTDV
jgi:hypothetical protein